MTIVPESVLSDAERGILEYLRTCDTVPTLQAIAERMGWRAKSQAHRLIERLIKLGFLERLPGPKRNIVVVDRTAAILKSQPTEALIAELASRGVNVPVHCAEIEHA